MQIPTVQDNVVESDRVLIVALGPARTTGSARPKHGVGDDRVAGDARADAHGERRDRCRDGGAATFTITADQAPVKDTSVNYQVVGTAQPGQDFEPLVGTAMLQAGQTSVIGHAAFDPEGRRRSSRPT